MIWFEREYLRRYPNFSLTGTDAIGCQGLGHIKTVDDPERGDAVTLTDCVCGGAINANHDALWINLDRVQRLRRFVNRAIAVSSCYRCGRHNEFVGGWENSQHLTSRAIDVHLRGFVPGRFNWEIPWEAEMYPVPTLRSFLDERHEGQELSLQDSLYVAMAVGGWPRAKLYEWGAHLATYGVGPFVQVDEGIELPAWYAPVEG